MAALPPPQRFNVPLMMMLRPAGAALGEPGERVLARDLSESGVRLTTATRPTVGEERDLQFVWGEEELSCRVRVVRHCDDGIAVTFVRPEAAFLGSLREALQDAKPTRPGAGGDRSA